MPATDHVRGPLALAAAAMMLSLGVSAALVAARPDLTKGAAFLFGDEGANLLVAHALQSGRSLYTEVAFPYGPAAIHLYAAAGARLGNTPTVYLGAMALLSALSAGMVAWLVRQCADVATTLVVIAVAVLPTMPLPGASIGGYTSSIYMPLERIGLLAGVLLWAPPWRRSAGRSIAIGTALGVCQGIRFGSGAVALAAIVLVDLAASLVRGSRVQRRQMLRASAAVALGFLLAELAWIAWAAVMLPRPYAVEMLWPLQMWETHRASIGVARWPVWAGWRMAVTQYALPVTALVLSVRGMAQWLRAPAADLESDEWRSQGAAVTLLAFFVLASALFFRHEHHFRQFAWMLVPPAAAASGRLPLGWRGALLVVCAAASWPLVSALASRASPDTVRLDVPRGYSLTVTRETSSRVEFLRDYTGVGPVLFVPNGAGWLYAFDVPHVTRHNWFYARAAVRPFEEASFTRDAPRAAVVIRCSAGLRTAAWPFPPGTVQVLEAQYRPVASGAGCEAWARSTARPFGSRR